MKYRERDEWKGGVKTERTWTDMTNYQGEKACPVPQLEKIVHALFIITLDQLFWVAFSYTVEHSDSMTCAEIEYRYNHHVFWAKNWHTCSIICTLIETIKSVLDIRIILENLGHRVAIIIANQLKSLRRASYVAQSI